MSEMNNVYSHEDNTSQIADPQGHYPNPENPIERTDEYWKEHIHPVVNYVHDQNDAYKSQAEMANAQQANEHGEFFQFNHEQEPS